MDLPRNRFKHALIEGRHQLGLWCSLSHHYSQEVVAGAAFDWLLLDMEHSPNDLESLLPQLQAVAAYPPSAVVRVPWNDTVAIKRVLDVGAQTLLIPYVQNVEEARAAVAATRAHEEICLLVQLETKDALQHLEAIAALDGIDGIFIGPADLHASLGHAGEIAHPQVWPLIEDAIGRIRAAGKAPGILMVDEKLAQRCIELGTLFTAVGSDVGILARGADALAARFQKARG
jgi:4-hydroxy-2-oxoheptanedioate aldolase